jgi:hypothetical protein
MHAGEFTVSITLALTLMYIISDTPASVQSMRLLPELPCSSSGDTRYCIRVPCTPWCLTLATLMCV